MLYGLVRTGLAQANLHLAQLAVQPHALDACSSRMVKRHLVSRQIPPPCSPGYGGTPSHVDVANREMHLHARRTERCHHVCSCRAVTSVNSHTSSRIRCASIRGLAILTVIEVATPSTAHGAPIRQSRRGASKVFARSPSRPLRSQIDGENRSRSSVAEQVCKQTTATAAPRRRDCFLIAVQGFPVPWRKIPCLVEQSVLS